MLQCHFFRCVMPTIRYVQLVERIRMLPYSNCHAQCSCKQVCIAKNCKSYAWKCFYLCFLCVLAIAYTFERRSRW